MSRFILCLGALLAVQVFAQDLRTTLFASADAARGAAVDAEAPLLAPDAYARGVEAYAAAEADLARGRNMDRIRNRLTDATRSFEQAAEAAEIAKITLAPLIKTRDDAMSASAQTFAEDLWRRGEESFNNAMRRLEAGDIRAARSRAESAEALYRDAELTAIKAQYLSQTRALLAQADQARVGRYAPRTLARARELLDEAERELNENRYDTDLPRSLAQQANREARHAIHLAERIRMMRNESWQLEDVILAYEEPLIQIAAAADQTVDLERGIDAVAADLARYIEDLRDRERAMAADLNTSRTRIAELEDEIRDLDEQLGGVSQERVALIQRLEAEARVREQFERIERMFARDEARVSRESNEIVLRMVGLTFASARSEVDNAHRALLEKVREALDVFPGSQAVIEGHTDSFGSDELNMALSRQRAEAVSSYLTNELGIEAFRLSAVGYGETRPIASNETPQGRERNRRIDIRIRPQAM